jgi:hypothetical protein
MRISKRANISPARLWQNRIITVISYTIALLSCVRIAVSQDLVAHYDFNNRTTDQSGNSNHGKLIGNRIMVPDRFGKGCSAMFFDGKSYVQVPNSSSLESLSSSITIAVWFKLTPQNGETYWLTVLCKGSDTEESENSPQFRLQVYQNSEKKESACNPFVGEESSTISLNTEFTRCDPNFMTYRFSPDLWTFFAMTYDGSNVKCYSQGRKVFEQPYNGPIIRNTNDLFIGLDEPGKREYMYGAIDDLRLFSRPLTEVEINELYTERSSGSNENIHFEKKANIVSIAQNKECGAIVHFNQPMVYNACNDSIIVSQVTGKKSGSFFETGRTRVEFEAKSSSGKSVTSGFYVIVKDITPPEIVITSDVNYTLKKIESGYRLVETMPLIKDECKLAIKEQVSGPKTGDLLKPGSYVQKFRAVDINGNQSENIRRINVYPYQSIIPPKNLARDTIEQIKTDSIVPGHSKDEMQQKIIDSIRTNKDSTYSHARREIDIAHTIEVDTGIITLMVYDNGIVDDDTISLYYDGDLLLYKNRISDSALFVRLEIANEEDHFLSLYADNLGRIPPNTAFIIIMDGNKRTNLELTSTEIKNGTILIRRKKKNK